MSPKKVDPLADGKQAQLPCMFRPSVKKEEGEEEANEEKDPEKTIISKDKKCYNKFNYRMRLADDEVKGMWAELFKKGDEKKVSEFMKVILDSKAGQVNKDMLMSFKTECTQSSEGTEGGWLAWKEVADKEGEEALVEMVKAGTVASRRHPFLPASSQIPWPMNLQIKYQVERFSKMRKVSEGTTLQKKPEEATAEAVAEFEKNLATSSTSNSTQIMGMASPPTPSSEAKSTMRPQDKSTVAAVRKVHAAWDRCCRDIISVITQSQENPNTQGCKFEKDLDMAMHQGKEKDSLLVSLERVFMSGTSYSDEETWVGAGWKMAEVRWIGGGEAGGAWGCGWWVPPSPTHNSAPIHPHQPTHTQPSPTQHPPKLQEIQKASDVVRECMAVIKEAQKKIISLKSWFKL